MPLSIVRLAPHGNRGQVATGDTKGDNQVEQETNDRGFHDAHQYVPLREAQLDSIDRIEHTGKESNEKEVGTGGIGKIERVVFIEGGIVLVL